MTNETTTSSRRAVLVGGLGAVAAVAVSSLARPEAALATDPNDVVLGATNVAATTTVINNTTTTSTVFAATNSSVGTGVIGASTQGVGVRGQSASGNGVEGSTDSAFGVYGLSNTGDGVYGQSTGGAGVFGVSNTGAGAHGLSTASTGVIGESTEQIGVVGVTAASDQPGVLGHGNGAGVIGGSGLIPANKPKTGVYGVAEQDANSRGVWGKSALGVAVLGESTSGRGIQGQATSGIGVRAHATSGIGVYADASTGYALRSVGRVRLDKSAGQASVASGTSSVVVTPGIDLISTSAVVATLNGDAGGSTSVKRVAINTTANTFTVYLTANATATVKIAWIVLG